MKKETKKTLTQVAYLMFNLFEIAICIGNIKDGIRNMDRKGRKS